VDANEVVVHEMKRDGCDVMLDSLGETICEASKAAHVHPHGEVLALHVGRADVLGIGLASDFLALATDALGGAVTRFAFACRT